MTIPITSPRNPRIQELVSLRNRSARDRSGQTRIEGFFEIDFALGAGAEPTALYYCPELVRPEQAATLLPTARARFGDVFELSRPVFEKAAYREGADGWLATIRMPRARLHALRLPDNPLLLVCEAVEKPGNLGAMLRTADAVGVAAVIATNSVTDIGNPNVIRASKGTVFTVPCVETTTPEAIAWLQQRGLGIVVTTPHTTTMMTAADLTGPTAIVMGAEDTGVTAAWLDAATTPVRIPMYGQIDSLNVSTAAAVLLYEAVRQRALPEPPRDLV